MKIALIAGLAISGAASAQILPGVVGDPFADGSLSGTNFGPTLWDQQPDPAQPGFIDQAFGDFLSFSTYTVSDVSFGSGVTINDITTYYTNLNGIWGGIGAASATLNIFPKGGTLPGAGDDPTTGTSVAVNISTGANGVEVHASGLNIALAAGDYWVGLTPELNFGTFGQEFLQGSANIQGDASASRNPGGGFGVGTDWVDSGATFGGIADWNGAITILGTPAPGTLALLGLGGLVATRRRR